ncbi:MAG TPA: hypothetical protein VNC84_06280 [Gammaproteobacteria bacterium]|jgi:hypothetical protein|nr:hypothetical protein [Gammaproteobacteria bacterium]
MTLNNKSISIIDRVSSIIAELKGQYEYHQAAMLELNAMQTSLDKLKDYLHSTSLGAHYDKKEVDAQVASVNVHLAILRTELKKTDYNKLRKGMKAVKTILKFHPTKYSPLAFAAAWLVEWLYFI